MGKKLLQYLVVGCEWLIVGVVPKKGFFTTSSLFLPKVITNKKITNINFKLLLAYHKTFSGFWRFDDFFAF